MPDLYDHLQEINKRLEQKKDFKDLWEDITPESVDYGLMEKVPAQDVYVIKAKFEWNDLGSWNSVYDVLSKLKNGNVVKGDGVVIDGKNNLIHSEDHFTAILGLDDITVVNTADATLVIPKADVEEVKVLVEWLEKKKRNDLL